MQQDVLHGYSVADMSLEIRYDCTFEGSAPFLRGSPQSFFKRFPAISRDR